MAVLSVTVHLETVKKKFTSFLMAMNVATLTSALPISIVVLVNHVLIENQAIRATVLTDLVALMLMSLPFVHTLICSVHYVTISMLPITVAVQVLIVHSQLVLVQMAKRKSTIIVLIQTNVLIRPFVVFSRVPTQKVATLATASLDMLTAKSTRDDKHLYG